MPMSCRTVALESPDPVRNPVIPVELGLSNAVLVTLSPCDTAGEIAVRFKSAADSEKCPQALDRFP